MVIFEFVHPEAEYIQLLEPPKCCLPQEVKMLVHLSRQTPGNILEIGTNFGYTAAELAHANPDKTIYTVDLVNADMRPEQAGDTVNGQTVGSKCRGYKNVEMFLDGIEKFDWSGKNITFAFIDGDHSYDGVRRDTAICFANIKRTGKSAILWHDCSIVRHRELWIGVADHVEHEIAIGRDVSSVFRTTLAYTRV